MTKPTTNTEIKPYTLKTGVCTPVLEQPDPVIEQLMESVIEPLKDYHKYRVQGLEHIPHHGRAILAISHSFATYDALLLGHEIYQETGRLITALGDNLIFKIPGLARFASLCGVKPANPKNGQLLLEQGRIVTVAPGGMREALRPSNEKYQVRWHKRKGFIRLALLTQTPIILAACPAADDLYSLYESRLTKLFYRYLKVPVPVLRGYGPTLLPRPVILTHYLSEPIHPPPLRYRHLEQQIDVFHADIVHAMNGLMSRTQ